MLGTLVPVGRSHPQQQQPLLLPEGDFDFLRSKIRAAVWEGLQARHQSRLKPLLHGRRRQKTVGFDQIDSQPTLDGVLAQLLHQRGAPQIEQSSCLGNRSLRFVHCPTDQILFDIGQVFAQIKTVC